MSSQMVPFGKYMPDLPDLNNPGLTRAENVVPLAGVYQQFASLSAATTALTARCQGAKAANDADGNTYIYAGDATKLYQIIGTTPTDKSGSTYTLGTSGYWKAVQYRNTIIFTNYTDNIQAATVNSGSFADLAAAAPKAQCIGVINLFVMVGNTNDASNGHVYNRLQWCGIDDPTNWPTPATSAAYAAQSGQKILNGDYGRVMHITSGLRFGLIFQERAIYRADYVGGGVVFAFSDFEKSRGLWAPNGVVSVGDTTYYLAQSGFHQTDGQSVQSIGTNIEAGLAYDQTFLADLNQSYLDRVYAGADSNNKLVFWAYPSTASTDGTPDKIAVYNYAEQRWSTVIQSCEFLFSAKSLGYTLEQLDNVSSSIDALPASLDSPLWTGGTPLLGAFDTSHNFGTFVGAALTATLETGEFQFSDGRSEYQGVKPFVTGSGTVAVQTASRQFQSDSVSFGSSVSPSTRSGIAPVRANNYYHRARITITGGFDQAIGAEHFFTESGQV